MIWFLQLFEGPIMQIIAYSTALCAAFALLGCAGPAPLPGDSVDTVKLKRGEPTAAYSNGNERLLEYATGPMGQYTWMAHIGADGRMTQFEQVLTGEKFATIKIGYATHDDVLRTVGRPAEKSYLPLRDFEVWSYR
jgi:hypothetical protein